MVTPGFCLTIHTKVVLRYQIAEMLEVFRESDFLCCNQAYSQKAAHTSWDAFMPKKMDAFGCPEKFVLFPFYK